MGHLFLARLVFVGLAVVSWLHVSQCIGLRERRLSAPESPLNPGRFRHGGLRERRSFGNSASLATNVSCGAPPTCKQQNTTMTNFSITRTDEYAWMRNANDPDVELYINTSNLYLECLLQDTQSLRESLYQEFADHSPSWIETEPARVGDYLYFSSYPDGLEYPVWYRRLAADSNASAQLVLDENEIKDRGDHDYFSLGSMVVSPDNTLLAFQADFVGNEHFTLMISNMTATAERNQTVIIEDGIVANSYYSLAWAADSRTVFYVVIDEQLLYPLVARRHLLFDDPSKDVTVFTETDPQYFVSVTKTADQSYVLIYSQGMVSNEVRMISSADPQGDFAVVYPRQPTEQYWVEHRNGFFYILTNHDGNYNFKLVRVPTAQVLNQSAWEPVVPHDDQVLLQRLQVKKDYVVVWTLTDCNQQIQVIPLAGETIGNSSRVPLSSLGNYYSVLPLSGLNEQETNFLYFDYETDALPFAFSTFLTPWQYYTYDMITGQLHLDQQEAVQDFDPELYQDERLFVPARDGSSQIPLTLVYRKSMYKKGTPQPLLLKSYGAYGTIYYPEFTYTALSLLDRGYVYAVAHVRGGGMRGALWYENGKYLQKNNTFNDFIDCAQWLVDNRWTTSKQLVAFGRSAGGLLMGAVLTQRPDLFQVIWAQVPYVDVINTMIDETIPWVVWEYNEWGNPRNETFFYYLNSYDPYQNIARRDYPHVIFQSGWQDPIVMYWEPTKFIAKLNAMKTDHNDAVLMTLNSGHLGATGFDYYADMAYQYAFILDRVELSPAAGDGDSDDEHKPGLLVPLLIFFVVVGIMALISIAYFVKQKVLNRRRQQYEHIAESPATRRASKDTVALM